MRLDGSSTDRCIYFRNQSSVAKIQSDAALRFDVGVSSSPAAAMYIQEDTRNVGIGTTAPAEKLTVQGNVSASGNISVPDSSKIISGNTNDLQMYHDGSESYISSSSELRINSDQVRILRNNLGEYMANFYSDCQHTMVILLIRLV